MGTLAGGRAGERAEYYASHSLRTGSATQAGGAPPEFPQREDRWASDACKACVHYHGKDAGLVASVTSRGGARKRDSAGPGYGEDSRPNSRAGRAEGDVRPMPMETRCCKVFLSNYSKKKPGGDTLVPPLRGKEENVCFFSIICSRCCARRNLRFHVENCRHADQQQLTRR